MIIRSHRNLSTALGVHPTAAQITTYEERGVVRCSTADLRARALTLAHAITEVSAPGDRVLLMFPQGQEFMTALFACWWAGVVPVPLALPEPARLQRTLARITSVVRDCAPVAVLSTRQVATLARSLTHLPGVEPLTSLRWFEVDAEAKSAPIEPPLRTTDIAVLQYTSGSTGTPKGVCVTHENVFANLEMLVDRLSIDDTSVFASWLPQFHDMGLIACTVLPTLANVDLTVLSPLSFLRDPVQWLQVISSTGSTHSGGPNFAFDHCAKRVTDEQVAGLDLSRWRCAWNGAESVRWSTLQRFSKRLAPAGFRADAFAPCYGLAEATLMVSVRQMRELMPLVVLEADVESFKQGRFTAATGGLPIVGCGRAPKGTEIRIVDALSLAPVADGVIGEVWCRGPHVARGYFAKVDVTFEAELNGHRYLRTGDLGFLVDGELFITGRVKDLVIVRGANLFPADVEHSVARASEYVRPGAVAAFGVMLEQGEELGIVAEVERRSKDRRGTGSSPSGAERRERSDRRSPEELLHRVSETPPDTKEIIRKIRELVVNEWGVSPKKIALIKPGTLPKTTSGKIQRLEARRLMVDGGLDLLEVG